MKGIAFIGGEAPRVDTCRALAANVDIIAAADSGLAVAEAAGLSPKLIAGDMDSLDDPRRLEKYPAEIIRRYPRDKDFTDTEIIVMLLRERGCDEIILAGGGGGRLSHLLALRAMLERADGITEWHTASASSYVARKGWNLSLSVPKGALVSVFPLFRGQQASGTPDERCRAPDTENELKDSIHKKASPAFSELIGSISKKISCTYYELESVSPEPSHEASREVPRWSATSEGLKWPLDGLAWHHASFGVSNVALQEHISIRPLAGNFLVIIEEE